MQLQWIGELCSCTCTVLQESIQLPEKDLAFQLQTLTKNKILIASEPKEVDGLCADQVLSVCSALCFLCLHLGFPPTMSAVHLHQQFCC